MFKKSTTISDKQNDNVVKLFKEMVSVGISELIDFRKDEQSKNLNNILNKSIAETMKSIKTKISENPFQKTYSAELAFFNLSAMDFLDSHYMYDMVNSFKGDLVGTSDEKKILKEIKDKINSPNLVKIEVQTEPFKYILVLHFEW